MMVSPALTVMREHYLLLVLRPWTKLQIATEK